MKNIDSLYSKITELNSATKNKLLKKGFVVPIQLKTGNIKIGHYVVQKNSNDFFEIINQKNNDTITNINLPQSAFVIANKLALGRWLDYDILNLDKQYGYAFFDEQVHLKSKAKSLKSKDYGRADIMIDKIEKAKNKKDYFKKLINENFQKLLNIR